MLSHGQSTEINHGKCNFCFFPTWKWVKVMSLNPVINMHSTTDATIVHTFKDITFFKIVKQETCLSSNLIHLNHHGHDRVHNYTGHTKFEFGWVTTYKGCKTLQPNLSNSAETLKLNQASVKEKKKKTKQSWLPTFSKGQNMKKIDKNTQSMWV